MRKMTLCLVAAVGAASLIASVKSAEGEGTIEQGSQEQVRCDIPADSITVTYTPAHPYRIGIIEIDEACTVSKRYDDLTAAEFAALAAEGHRGDEMPQQASLDEGSGDRGFSPAATYTKKVKGRQVLCHDVGITCVDMVEVSSELRWWYDNTRVTSYGEGLGRRWTGSCWDFSGGLSTWWSTDRLPSRVRHSAHSAFKTSLWPPCPWLPGGWLRTDTWGWYNGSYSVTCAHSDLRGFPPPTRVRCWAELL